MRPEQTPGKPGEHMNKGLSGGFANLRYRCLMLESPRDIKKFGGMSSARERRNSVPKGISPANKLSDLPGNGEVGGKVYSTRAYRSCSC